MWKELQWAQEKHDRLYHPDIYYMPKPYRLTHLVLHLAKYQGKYIQIKNFVLDSDKIAIDACIILVSFLNCLNQRILHVEAEDVGMEEIVVGVGRLAKYLEGLDHLENLDYHNDMVIIALQLLSYWTYKVLRGTSANEWCRFKREYLERLKEIEEKNMFNRELKTSETSLL